MDVERVFSSAGVVPDDEERVDDVLLRGQVLQHFPKGVVGEVPRRKDVVRVDFSEDPVDCLREDLFDSLPLHSADVVSRLWTQVRHRVEQVFLSERAVSENRASHLSFEKKLAGRLSATQF